MALPLRTVEAGPILDERLRRSNRRSPGDATVEPAERLGDGVRYRPGDGVGVAMAVEDDAPDGRRRPPARGGDHGTDERLATLLRGEWFHAHEEDAAGAAVYRPASYELPPARMPRDSIRFGGDGAASIGSPDAADRHEHRPARWRIRDHQVTVTMDDRSLVFELDTRDPDAPALRQMDSTGAGHGQQGQQAGG